MTKLPKTLAPEGLDAGTLAATAQRMSRAREALRLRALEAWTLCGREGPVGDLTFNRDRFAGYERDTQMRLLASALQYVASAKYRPRATQLESLLDRLLSGGSGTLHGCAVRTDRDALHILREPAATTPMDLPPGETVLWDGKWQVSHTEGTSITLRALAEDGWQQLPPDTRAALPGGLSHATAQALPSLWDGDRLLACAPLRAGSGTTAVLQDANGFPAFLLSH